MQTFVCCSPRHLEIMFDFGIVYMCICQFCQLIANKPFTKFQKAVKTFWLITSCARGDTIRPRPSPPPLAPKRLVRRRADATYQSVHSHAEYVHTLTAAAA